MGDAASNGGRRHWAGQGPPKHTAALPAATVRRRIKAAREGEGYGDHNLNPRPCNKLEMLSYIAPVRKTNALRVSLNLRTTLEPKPGAPKP